MQGDDMSSAAERVESDGADTKVAAYGRMQALLAERNGLPPFQSDINSDIDQLSPSIGMLSPGPAPHTFNITLMF